MHPLDYTLRSIEAADDGEICRIIKAVGAEFGAIGEGFGPSDPEVLSMSRHYHKAANRLYLVATIDNKLMGGGGISSFHGSREICELRKVFLVQEGRNLGIGKKLTLQCLEYARAQHFRQCYLDTLSSMKSAIRLYETLGFKHLEEPLDETIHNGCNVWMIKEL